MLILQQRYTNDFALIISSEDVYSVPPVPQGTVVSHTSPSPPGAFILPEDKCTHAVMMLYSNTPLLNWSSKNLHI